MKSTCALLLRNSLSEISGSAAMASLRATASAAFPSIAASTARARLSYSLIMFPFIGALQK
jgi:hypothetical protein